MPSFFTSSLSTTESLYWYRDSRGNRGVRKIRSPAPVAQTETFPAPKHPSCSTCDHAHSGLPQKQQTVTKEQRPAKTPSIFDEMHYMSEEIRAMWMTESGKHRDHAPQRSMSISCDDVDAYAPVPPKLRSTKPPSPHRQRPMAHKTRTLQADPWRLRHTQPEKSEHQQQQHHHNNEQQNREKFRKHTKNSHHQPPARRAPLQQKESADQVSFEEQQQVLFSLQSLLYSTLDSMEGAAASNSPAKGRTRHRAHDNDFINEENHINHRTALLRSKIEYSYSTIRAAMEGVTQEYQLAEVAMKELKMMKMTLEEVREWWREEADEEIEVEIENEDTEDEFEEEYWEWKKLEHREKKWW